MTGLALETCMEIFPWYLRENCGKLNKECELTAGWEQKLRESRGSGDIFLEKIKSVKAFHLKTANNILPPCMRLRRRMAYMDGKVCILYGPTIN